jgi:hypothetical protein
MVLYVRTSDGACGHSSQTRCWFHFWPKKKTKSLDHLFLSGYPSPSLLWFQYFIYLFICGLFNYAVVVQTLQRQMTRRLMNNALERLWTEVVGAQLRPCPGISPEGLRKAADTTGNLYSLAYADVPVVLWRLSYVGPCCSMRFQVIFVCQVVRCLWSGATGAAGWLAVMTIGHYSTDALRGPVVGQGREHLDRIVEQQSASIAPPVPLFRNAQATGRYSRARKVSFTTLDREDYLGQVACSQMGRYDEGLDVERRLRTRIGLLRNRGTGIRPIDQAGVSVGIITQEGVPGCGQPILPFRVLCPPSRRGILRSDSRSGPNRSVGGGGRGRSCGQEVGCHELHWSVCHHCVCVCVSVAPGRHIIVN